MLLQLIIFSVIASGLYLEQLESEKQHLNSLQITGVMKKIEHIYNAAANFYLYHNQDITQAQWPENIEQLQQNNYLISAGQIHCNFTSNKFSYPQLSREQDYLKISFSPCTVPIDKDSLRNSKLRLQLEKLLSLKYDPGLVSVTDEQLNILLPPPGMASDFSSLLPTNGSRAMQGDLDMSGNSILNTTVSAEHIIY